MAIQLEIKFSIPTNILNDEFKTQLNNVGFYVEEISPCIPSGHEVMAYKMKGLFNGEWKDVFAAWNRALSHVKIQEAIMKEVQNK